MVFVTLSNLQNKKKHSWWQFLTADLMATRRLLTDANHNRLQSRRRLIVMAQQNRIEMPPLLFAQGVLPIVNSCSTVVR